MFEFRHQGTRNFPRIYQFRARKKIQKVDSYG